MTFGNRILSAAILVIALPALAAAQATVGGTVASNDRPVNPVADTLTTAPASSLLEREIVIQHIRPQDKRGLNIFESPKDDNVLFRGFRLDFGAAFTQQFQGLSHENTALPRMVSGADANKLIEIGNGFNNATANLYVNAQLARGIRVALTTYLSSRHHNETWVKDGYLLIDESPLDVPLLNSVMKYATLRLGHFEVNYGDAHFRRSDNGNAMHNPLIGNYIMDAFTTEIGGEVYVRAHGLLAMAGVTGGEVRGQVTRPDDRSPTFLAKVGFDRRLKSDLRVRLTASSYTTSSSVNNTLYSGDRAGSRYYSVLENTTSVEASQAWSGAIQPGLRSEVRAFVLNPFVKYRGLELFGNIEQVRGRAVTETATRKWTQNVAEAVYRFGPREALYLATRYNTARGRLTGLTNDVGVNRTQVGGGWFVAPTILMKAEYVTQRYNDFPATDIRSGGRFNGFMIEGVVAF